jgi:ATP-dependent Clp protease ATP-binding subunit ClpC
VDFSSGITTLVLAGLILGFVFRKQIRAWLNGWRKPAKPAAAVGEVLPPEPFDLQALTGRLYELDKSFAPFGSNAAHPSDLYAQPDFREAVRLLSLRDVPLATVMQYVEGNSWSLSSAALAALRKRLDRNGVTDRVLTQCDHFSPWAMYFALELLFEAEPRVAVGAPLSRAKDWWIENRWMPNVFRDYLARCAARDAAITFGSSLTAWRVAPHDVIRKFLRAVTHPAAATLIEELDNIPSLPDELDAPNASAENTSALNAVGRFWKNQQGIEILVEPDGWRKPFALAESTLRQHPVRSLLVSGEPMVGKTSFLRLFAQRIAADGWSVFEASGADLQADQIYIGQLEGRIRQVVEELGKGRKLIWYIPDIVQLALSGTHSGQSATMLDQIIPAVAAGRLVVWAEATPKGTARLVRIKPSLRGLFETVTIEPLSQAETLSLASDVIIDMAEQANIRFDPECAKVALDTACQYLGSGGLPGSALLMLKLTAVHRAGDRPGRGGPGRGRAHRHAQGGTK